MRPREHAPPAASELGEVGEERLIELVELGPLTRIAGGLDLDRGIEVTLRWDGVCVLEIGLRVGSRPVQGRISFLAGALLQFRPEDAGVVVRHGLIKMNLLNGD